MVNYRLSLKTLLVLLAALGLGLAGQAHAQDGVINLTLSQAIKMAVEKNLDVKAELYNPASAEANIRKNKGIYDPLVNFNVNYEESTTQPASIFLAGTTLQRTKILTADPGINQLIPIGGTVGLVFNNTWNRNNSSLERGFLNDYWESELSLNFTQPLLKNFGREATELNISVAKFNKQGSWEQFKTRLIDVIAQVRTQYFQLYSLRENLEVKKTSLVLAERILSDTKAQVKAGVLPAMEILSAEFGVATMQKNLIDAERALKDQQDALTVLLQLPVGENIIPTDNPYRGRYEVDESSEISKALAQRPELKQLQVTLKSNELQSRVARNQTLPDLSFVANGALTGLGISYSKDLEKVGSGNYPVWGVGLQFSYPLGNRTAENDYIRSKLLVEQNKVQIKSLEDSIVNDVRNAVRALHSGYIQLDVTARGSAYAEERLQAFIKKSKVGLATTKDVLDVQNDMVTAKGNQIQAVTDYNNAITSLWRASGELLEKEGITVSEKEADALYGQNRN
jgi:outer membrane protein